MNENNKGLLIVVEGTDGSGKTTQINLLKRWLEDNCYATKISKVKTSKIISNLIDEAKANNVLTPTTFSLLYALDFADRLETSILPALKSGFVVLMDKYIYTQIVRDAVRRHDLNWIKKVYDFAPKPDFVFYLDVPIDVLTSRINDESDFDYYESGQDMNLDENIEKSFIKYQSMSIEAFEELRNEHNFITINGNDTKENVHEKIKAEVLKVLETGILD